MFHSSITEVPDRTVAVNPEGAASPDEVPPKVFTVAVPLALDVPAELYAFT